MVGVGVQNCDVLSKCLGVALLLECKTEPKAGLMSLGEAAPTSSQESSAWLCCPTAVTPTELSQS